MKKYLVRTPSGIDVLRTDLLELAVHAAAVVLGSVFELNPIDGRLLRRVEPGRN